MKKNIKITSIALVFVIISTLFSFTISAVNKPEEVTVDFQISNIKDKKKDTKTVELGINLETANKTEFQSINAILEYDATILSPIPWGIKGDEIYSNIYDTQTAIDASSAILVGTKGPDEYSGKYAKIYEDKTLNKGYISLFAESLIPKKMVNERIITTRFAFNDGYSWNDVTTDTIKLADSKIIENFGESDAAVTYFAGGFSSVYTYMPADGTTGKLKAKNIKTTLIEDGKTVDGNVGPTDPSDFVSLNVYDWDDTKLKTQVVPKGEDITKLLPVAKPLPGYIFAGWTSRMTPELDVDGNPVLDNDGNPVMVRNQSTPNVLTGTPGVKYPAEKLVDVTNITENMDLIPAFDEDASIIESTASARRYTIAGRTPFVAEGVDLKTTVTVKREPRTRRIVYNNGTVTIRVGYNTFSQGTVNTFIEGGTTDEEGIDVLVSATAKDNYAGNAVSIAVFDGRSISRSNAFNIKNTDCVIGK